MLARMKGYLILSLYRQGHCGREAEKWLKEEIKIHPWTRKTVSQNNEKDKD